MRSLPVVALCLLAACSNPTPTPVGTVTGTLLDAHHHPLAGLTVSAKLARSTWQSPAPASGTNSLSFTDQAIDPDAYSRATTAPDGHFSLAAYHPLVDVAVLRPAGTLTILQPVKANVAVSSDATTDLGTVVLPDLPAYGASATTTPSP